MFKVKLVQWPDTTYTRYTNLTRLGVKWIVNNFRSLLENYSSVLSQIIAGNSKTNCYTYDVEGQTHEGASIQLMIGAYKGHAKIHIGTKDYMRWLTRPHGELMSRYIKNELAGHVIPLELIEALVNHVAPASPDFLA